MAGMMRNAVVWGLAVWLLMAGGVCLAADDAVPAEGQSDKSEKKEAPKPAAPNAAAREAALKRAREAQAAKANKNADQKAAAPGAAAKAGNQAARPSQPNTASIGSSVAKSTGPALGEYTVAIDADSGMLRIHPKGKADRQDMQVTVGEEFESEVSFDNRASAGFDELRVYLSYDTEYLEPEAINDSKLAEYLRVPPTAQVDPLSGVILYEAQLKKPVVFSDVPLVTIRWKAKKVTLETPIEFSSMEDSYTAVVGDGQDLLGNSRMPGDGTLDMTVTILPEDPREAEAMLTDPTIFQGTGEKIGGVKMYIRPPAETPSVGRPVALDLVLDNRAYSNLDGIGVLLQFDPDVFQVVDSDKDNYITLETNILDGAFHEEFPWSYQIDNVAYNTRGLISYRMGTGDSDMTRGKVGTFARIYLMAKRPTSGTPIVFKFVRDVRAHGTEATYNGQDCLGDPKVFADGTQGIVLRVLPGDGPDFAATLSEAP